MEYRIIGEISPYLKKLVDLDSFISDVAIFEGGLKKHLVKQKHGDALIYFNKIAEIISTPDYVGINPKEKNESMELIKRYDSNVLLALKVDKKNNCYYIPTMYTVSEYKVKQRLYSGRLKKVDRSFKE
ncbi:PBECR3 domain-containing polyvalent protein [Streptococcus dentapri]|uniref:Phage-Barnase-EndoU-ColicinE5/D-RelE like nuclease 3 domain-containing protein n=1 Tax=Streptococcus dentapri TaxID=573564 RepID=A0ABV8D1G4_9STRE